MEDSITDDFCPMCGGTGFLFDDEGEDEEEDDSIFETCLGGFDNKPTRDLTWVKGEDSDLYKQLCQGLQTIGIGGQTLEVIKKQIKLPKQLEEVKYKQEEEVEMEEPETEIIDLNSEETDLLIVETSTPTTEITSEDAKRITEQIQGLYGGGVGLFGMI